MNLPLPPHELRVQVGPTEAFFFDNPSGGPLFKDVPKEAYESVFDWGCGCGRLARQLIQQREQPQRYVGVDLNRGAVEWCRENLAPHAPQFEFHHQDIYSACLNPTGNSKALPFPVEDRSVSLLLAWSVFTHVLEPNAQFYLDEVARVLRPDGLALTTWMLFDKSDFPMMKDFQNALYINLSDPTNAVIYDKTWLREAARRSGLVLTKIGRPPSRCEVRLIDMRPASLGAAEAEFPPDPLANELHS